MLGVNSHLLFKNKKSISKMRLNETQQSVFIKIIIIIEATES